MSQIELENKDIGMSVYTTPYLLPLIAPVEDTDGVKIVGINLQEPTIAEIEVLSTNTQKYNSIKAFQTLLANHSGLDIPTIKKIGARDFSAIQKYYDYFFGE
ncbi:phage tail assembly protein [Acinetobacter guillouiae]|uniref:phage tail assembly protein n=1 Tax=Acinetobacter guillouiae TaxID=106649 RepID=UPI0032B36F84